ncbi:MAG: DUF5946 family protein [Spirosomataceae bacterium]
MFDYATKAGIEIEKEGRCQCCHSNVSKGVFECHGNLNHLTQILDFNDFCYYETRFLSVDAMALQHCEFHGPWNNHIHLTRLYLILEKNIKWDYSKTPLLSNIINAYKKDKTEFLTPPRPGERGQLTTVDLLNASTPEECVDIVKSWATEVYHSFSVHQMLISLLANNFLNRYG